jgi:hypothetical protein
MARLADSPKDEAEQMKGLLYHPHGPCANPGRGVMMNKPVAVGVYHGCNFKAARSWLTD